MFQDNWGLKPVSARGAVTAQTAASTWHCSGEWQLRLAPMVLIAFFTRHEPWSLTSPAMARYWTSVQSIDGIRWRNVPALAGVPGFSCIACGSLARGALPPTSHPPPRLAP
jgi:hypothetical protein